jgi:hypothetical protein
MERDQKLTESQREIQWADLGVGGLKMTAFEHSFHCLHKRPDRIKIGYVMDSKLRKLEELWSSWGGLGDLWPEEDDRDGGDLEG